MDEKPTLSIIVPVYNTEAYLRQCIDSILGQSCRDFELILVDDGSADSSPLICDEYAAADPRVRVIHKPNGGASAARNTGLTAARSEYILFVDGDDYIANDSLSKIMSANGADGPCDVVFLDAVHIMPDGSAGEPFDSYDKSNYYNKSHGEVLAYLAAHDPLPVCVWGKLIRRAVLDDNAVRFTEGIICEDVDFCLKLYMHAKTYNYISTEYYYYREGRAGSVMNVNTGRKYYDLFFIISRWAALADTDYREHAAHLHTILAFQLCMLLPFYYNLPPGERKDQKPNIAGLAWLLGRSRDKKVRAVNAVRKLFGVNGAARLLGFYGRLKRARNESRNESRNGRKK